MYAYTNSTHAQPGRNDGFGIVIVTFVVQNGKSEVTLKNDSDKDGDPSLSCNFEVTDGQYWGMCDNVSTTIFFIFISFFYIFLSHTGT